MSEPESFKFADPWLSERYPTLARLFAAYFHEDWALEAPTPEAVIIQFRADDGAEVAQRGIAEIERLLQDAGSDAELTQALATLASCYSPADSGISPRTWLTHVGQILARAG